MANIFSSSIGAQKKTDLSVSLGLSIALLFFLSAGVISYLNIRILQNNSDQITHIHLIILDLDDLLSVMKDAETGQRGFLITGDEHYLDPYNSALTRIQNRLDDLDMLTKGSPDQNNRIPEMERHIRAKLAELKKTIDLRRDAGFDAARAVVVSDLGKSEMDVLRSQISTFQSEEQAIQTRRLSEMETAYHSTAIASILTCLLGIILSTTIAYLMRRAAFVRQKNNWLQTGQVKLSEVMLGDPQAKILGEKVLKQMSEYLNASAGAFFLREGDDFRRIAIYGLPTASVAATQFKLGDGLLGQAAKDAHAFIVNNVPDGYLTIGTAMGHSNPRHMIVCPTVADDYVNAVFELGFLQPPNDAIIEFLEVISQTIGVAVRSANYRSNLQNLLEETQRQAEELQAQGEELRVNNEELEEQSRALKESQGRLEQQQAELEQTNAQLEEQAQLLEVQRDDLERSNEAVQLKAHELEKASQYKSDFLANMSHELRTPLNSSLILAKLLADNPNNNLTDEQVKFAQTIQSSGNDLLNLINDILDLSKIEAGHMDVRAESTSIERIGSHLNRTFAPIAKQKGLELKIEIDADCPAAIETDPLRLEQILKNLLSNSMKFTEKGHVALTIKKVGKSQIAFMVSDTGIGIAPENQQAIFDAFRQADGTINRKYGGTGLGLSISRELTRLLGGAINLNSMPGEGSTFTIMMPEHYQAPLTEAHNNIKEVEILASPALNAQSRKNIKKASKNDMNENTKRSRKTEDDRERIEKSDRIILVVEDDISFSNILYDLAHQHGFLCLVTNTAEEALELAWHYMPSAVLLDVGLPDHSGLSVLDRLKRDQRTRHIPVHVISANDYMQTAYSLGAVGYMLKPVKRDQIENVLTQLEKHLAKETKRVLIVEDNQVQRESMIKLLSANNVETIGVGSASECLEQLAKTTFDCMVLDISLPDSTGYALLETLSEGSTYSFPPVIVYTGHNLSPDEEQRLRRYSSAIIIKGAKSPERLLDEVTLFLHQIVAELPPEQQNMLASVKNRDEILEGRRILAVEDDIRNVYALTSIFEPLGVHVQIARNGLEALDALRNAADDDGKSIDLVLMDVMMPEMDGLTATRKIRQNKDWQKIPIIMLTAKAMKDDQERCLEAGANDYMAKPLDVEKLMSLVRVWMPR